MTLKWPLKVASALQAWQWTILWLLLLEFHVLFTQKPRDTIAQSSRRLLAIASFLVYICHTTAPLVVGGTFQTAYALWFLARISLSFSSNKCILLCSLQLWLKWGTHWRVLKQVLVLTAPLPPTHTTLMQSSWSLPWPVLWSHWHSPAGLMQSFPSSRHFLAGLVQLFWPNSQPHPVKS